MATTLTSEQILEKTLQRVAPLPSQAGYARALATIFSMHLRKNLLMDEGLSPDELPSPSAVVVAPTGQGKTFLLRKMAESIGVNVIIIDCSTLSAEGWKGISLSQRLAAACKATDEASFKQSVLFLDEFDKLRFWGTNNDQGNAMTNILQLYNGETVAVEIGKETRNIDISRFTILLGGAFEGLDKIIQERICPKAPIGFGSDVGEKPPKAQLLQQATIADLSKYGLMPELLGRIGTVLSIPPLEIEDYRQLLNAEAGSLQRKYNNYLSRLYGVSFEIADGGVEAIAQKCLKEATGARAVNPLVNDMMRAAIYAVESQDSICKVILDTDEDGCCVQYEHGSRCYAFHDPTRVQPDHLPWYTIKKKTTSSLVKKLCRFYWDAEGNPDVMPELEAFLSCTLSYLHHRCKPSEFTFDNLEKLARTTRRGDVCSPYDIIMQDAHYHAEDSYKNLNKLYTPWLQQNLISALQAIMAHIQKKNGPCRVRFDVPAGK